MFEKLSEMNKNIGKNNKKVQIKQQLNGYTVKLNYFLKVWYLITCV